MIKIVKDGHVNNVTLSAFNNYFKSQGWEIAGGINPPVSPKVENIVEDNEEISDEDWDSAIDELKDDEVEKPISEMNKQELLNKAKSIGVEASADMTNKQIRELIKSHK